MAGIPNISIRGIRQTLPSGYLVGRVSPGGGPAELIPLDLAQTKLSAASGGGGGGGVQEWTAGPVSALSTGLSIVSGTLTVTFPDQEWNAGTVTAVGTNLSLAAGTLSAITQPQEWNAGTVNAIGSGLTLTSGTLVSSGGGGSSVMTMLLGTLNSENTGAFATKGIQFTTSGTVNVTNLWTQFESVVNGSTYVATIGSVVSGSSLGAVIATSTVIAPATYTGGLNFVFSPAATLAPLGKYYFAATIANGGSTAINPVIATTSAFLIAPGFEATLGFFAAATNAIANGQSVSIATGGPCWAVTYSGVF